MSTGPPPPPVAGLNNCSPLGPLRPVLGRPVQAAGVDADFPLVHCLAVLVDGFAIDAHNVLALVVVDQVEVLQRRDDILLLDAGQFADLAVLVGGNKWWRGAFRC